ncbi:uncharacterized protein FOKN1_2915 [Thiohalobacter thiocyanaticus]|uniref:Uncharacterized protein n=1 Tax=Thiohalobacter thiocyanaticus TaxID=585455 RepID=A0A1Z4VUT9_9GAMM|nr:uncharacterized protein FOKN1_2915 [Thiohalobacter thiocyanaticus]
MAAGIEQLVPVQAAVHGLGELLPLAGAEGASGLAHAAAQRSAVGHVFMSKIKSAMENTESTDVKDLW